MNARPDEGDAAWQRRRRDAAWTLLLALMVLAWDFSGLDLVAVRAFGGPEGFAFRNTWWASGVLHSGARLVAWGLFFALLINIWRPWTPALVKAERVRWVLITLACVTLVPALKRLSLTSCPWDLQAFGGVAPYVSHWQPVGDGGPGHCFPSGHAVAAFAFISGWFVLRSAHPRAARRWLAAVGVAGFVLGLAQLVRGAHYPSHVLWSGWLCWTLSWLLSECRRPAGPRASHR